MVKVSLFSSFVVCKFKAHKRCAVKAQSNCKWTTLAAIGREILEDEDGVSNHGVGVYMYFHSMGLQQGGYLTTVQKTY